MIAGRLVIDDAVRLLRAAGSVFAEREAQVIFVVFTEPRDRVIAVERRCSGIPLEYVVGVAQFAGVRVSIGPPAFIPRRRAEALVDAAVERTDAVVAARPPRALDLGCGCGAIAAALTVRLPAWDVRATDIDVDALVHARTNAARFGFTVHQGDWWGGLPDSLRGSFDLVVAHLPYVPTSRVATLPRDFLGAEPLRTVDGGSDGLDPWRQVASDATQWLTTTGAMLTQVTHDQQAEAVAVGQRGGLRTETVETEDGVVIVGRSARS